ncbi:MAG: GNAT family N-acetyltransferase [Spirochaetes bacterium]|nr:GNAT family N-acetyltransferase [Spirochaetota bacterium]
MQTQLNFSTSEQRVSYADHALALFNIRGFARKVDLYLEKENYIIKTAQNTDEVMKAIELRSKVFLEEIVNADTGSMDIDEYDILSDHLLLIDKHKDSVIGTYRFNSNLFSNSFYSENEFDIFNVLITPGIKLELGRACIQNEYRGGITISLLWTGLLAYIKNLGANFLFGCSSFHIPDKLYTAQVYKFLCEKHKAEENLTVFPRTKYKIEDLDLFLLQVENSARKDYLLSQRFIPGLVKGYLSAGAKICGKPVYDPDFNCYDFFTLLDLKNLNREYVKLVTI